MEERNRNKCPTGEEKQEKTNRKKVQIKFKMNCSMCNNSNDLEKWLLALFSSRGRAFERFA